MTLRSIRLLILTLMGVSLAAAAVNVGTLTTSGAVKIRGVNLQVASIPSWPVAAGDQIVTGPFDAVIVLRDNSRIQIGQNTTVRLEAAGDGVDVRVDDGVVIYQISPGSSTRVFNAAGVPNRDVSGQVNVDDDGERNPPRRRPVLDTPTVPELEPRSPNSPCAGDVQAIPARQRCEE